MTTFSHRLAISTATAALALSTVPAFADTMLPAPYVSRALDAVLLPIDANVRSVFDLARDDTGLLVLATQPDGVADAYGIVPGDVIHMIGGRKVAKPIELDQIVYYWILEGVFDFDLGLYRDGGVVEVLSTISEESYWEMIEVSTIETWSSWEVETSFSYEEYYAEYSEEIVESYEYSETSIEEMVTSEEFSSEMSEEVSEEGYESEEVSEDVMDEDTSEEITDEERPEEDMAADEMTDDEAADDSDMADEEMEDAPEEAEEDSADDGSSDEGASDEGGDEG
jgi:hypothetical protein